MKVYGQIQLTWIEVNALGTWFSSPCQKLGAKANIPNEEVI